MSKELIKIYKYQRSENVALYIFSKSKNHCLLVEYDKTWDFGKNDTSGAEIQSIQIHYKNHFILDKYNEIILEEVPDAIKDILSFLK